MRYTLITVIALVFLTFSTYAGNDVGRYQLCTANIEFSATTVSTLGADTKVNEHKTVFLLDTVTGRVWQFEWWAVSGGKGSDPKVGYYWGEEIKLHSGLSIGNE